MGSFRPFWSHFFGFARNVRVESKKCMSTTSKSVKKRGSWFLKFVDRSNTQCGTMVDFAQKSNFFANYCSDRQTSKTNFPYFFTLFEVVDKRFLIRPAQFAQIQKNHSKNGPNDPVRALSRTVTPKI